MVTMNFYMDDQYANLLIHECLTKKISYSDECDIDKQMHYILVHCKTLKQLKHINSFTNQI